MPTIRKELALATHPAASLRRNRDFLKLWAGQTISQFGSKITLLALPLTAAHEGQCLTARYPLVWLL